MATPRDRAQARSFEVPPDDEPVAPEAARGALPDDPEVPEADAWEQSQEVPFDDEEPA